MTLKKSQHYIHILNTFIFTECQRSAMEEDKIFVLNNYNKF